MKPTHLLTCGLIIGILGLPACTAPVQNSSTTGQETTSGQATSVSEQTKAEQTKAEQTRAQAGQTTSQAAVPQATCTAVDQGFGPQGQVKVRVEEVVTGLEVPWGLAFLPNGNLLVTERAGRIRLVQGGKLRSQPVARIDVADEAEGGLLGIAAHPNIARNRWFYVYYTANQNGSLANRVERWVLSQDGLSATRDRTIIDGIPVAQYHNGGRIRFGPDGMLYIGTGDARNPDSSQDVKSLAGKILRVTADGQIPPDNPFPGSPVYIMGIRNTQGFDWVNASTLWVTDHGPSGELGRTGHDKVSVARAGNNLGWPTLYQCESKPGLVTPSIVWRQALPPGGAAIYTGNAIPEWKGSLIVAALRAEQLQRITFNPQSPGQVQHHEVYLQGAQGRLRDVIMGPDNQLYVTTSNCDGRGRCPPQQDKILRITR